MSDESEGPGGGVEDSGLDLYPIPLGQGLKGSWFQFDFRVFNENTWARKVPAEAGWFGLRLMMRAPAQATAGTLPDDDIELADLAGFGRDVEGWRRLRPDALAEWRRVLCSNDLEDEVRLAHPWLTAAIVAAVNGVEKLRDGREEANLRKRLERLRNAMRRVGLTERAVMDAHLQQRLLDWLDGNGLTMRQAHVRDGLNFFGLQNELGAQVTDLKTELVRRGLR